MEDKQFSKKVLKAVDAAPRGSDVIANEVTNEVKIIAPVVLRPNVCIALSQADRELLGKAFGLPLAAAGKDYKRVLLDQARKTLEGVVLAGK